MKRPLHYFAIFCLRLTCSPVTPAIAPGITPRFPAIAPGIPRYCLRYCPGIAPAIAPRMDFVFKGPYSPAIAFFPSKTMFGISRKRKRPISDCGAVLANFIRRLYLGLKALPEGFSEANVDKCGKNVDNLWITLEKLLKTCTSTCSLE